MEARSKYFFSPRRHEDTKEKQVEPRIALMGTDRGEVGDTRNSSLEGSTHGLKTRVTRCGGVGRRGLALLFGELRG